MGQKGTVLVNGRSVVTASSDGRTLGSPNICKTPMPVGPPILIPYVSTAESANLSDYDATVLINGAPVFTEGSNLFPSRGDEAGTLGGVISGTHGDRVQPITSSRDVTIGGKGICRHADSTWQNKRNGLGVVNQGVGLAGSKRRLVDEADDSVECCLICAEESHPTPQASPVGNHLRKGSKGINLRLQEQYSATSCGQKKARNWLKHPWYYSKQSLQVHHLIDCNALRQDKNWANRCKAFGYDINDKHNGVVLTAVREIACALMVPLHRGNHDYAPVYDHAGEKRASVEGASARQSNKNPKFFEVYLCYPEAVRDRISAIHLDCLTGTYCADSAAFVADMNRASADILQKVVSFSWSLTADGRNYREGQVGCSTKETELNASCGDKDGRSRKHQKLLKELGDAAVRHKIEIGK